MNLHDRLRAELRDRSAHIAVRAADTESVIGTAQARLRRTRVMGVAAAFAMVVGVAGAALALRDSDQQLTTDQSASIAGSTEPEAQDDNASQEQEISAPTKETPAETTDDQAANTEPENPSPASISDDLAEEPLTDTGGSNGDDATTPNLPSDSGPVAEPASPTGATHLLSHNGGFVAQRQGSHLWYSADGTSWSEIPSPAPNETVSFLASFNGSLYAASTATTVDSLIPWVRFTADMVTWTDLTVPQPEGDGSPLTRAFNSVTGFAVGPAGVIVTGETIVDINVREILDAETFSSNSWTLGTNTGDRSKIVIYDTATGDPIEEIDLADLDIPEASLDLWLDTRPTPFVAAGNNTLTLLDTHLDKGTILRNVVSSGDQYLAAGFSRQFSSQILWTSADARVWEAVPVSVIAKTGADVVGALARRVVVFSTQGPSFTVQVRDGADWSEVRLHEMFGGPNDSYQLLDAAFADTGVAAAISSTDAANNTTIYMATSTNGTKWTVAALDDLADSFNTVVAVDSLTVNGTKVAVSYEPSNGPHATAVIPLSLR
jgi:hypothetical protein